MASICRRTWTASILWAILGAPLVAQQSAEDEYYRLIRFPIPERIVLEASALDFIPGGELAIATRRGEIYVVDEPLREKTEDVSFSLFASGLHEPLGLAWGADSLYCVQRG